MKTKPSLLLFLALGVLLSLKPAIAQQTTAFTYQGQLRDGGTNANGDYTMTFKLYDALSGGGQIGSTLNTSPTLANGLFTVNLDFGAGAFDGTGRWLDITVSNGVAQTLSPRVQVLPAPYALYSAVAATVTNGAIMNAQLAGNAVNTTNIQNNAVTTTQIANGAVTNRNLTANAVNATNIASGQVVKGLNGLTENVILGAGANVGVFTNGNTLQISASVPNMQVFRDDGAFTFTVPAGVTRVMAETWGAGGGGGGRGSTSTNGLHSGGAGGGGGGGGYAKGIISVTPGDIIPVTVGSSGIVGSNGVIILGIPRPGWTGSSGGFSSFGSFAAGGGNGGNGGGAGSDFTEGNNGHGGDPGDSPANFKIKGVQGGGGVFIPIGANAPGGAGANGGAGGAGSYVGGFPGSNQVGQSPGGGGASGQGGAIGRVVIYY